MLGNFIKVGLTGWKIVINSHAFSVFCLVYSGWAINEGYRAINEIIKERQEIRKNIKEKEELLRQLEKEAEEKKKKEAEEKARKQKEAEEAFERLKRELEDDKKNDPMKKEFERLINQANRLLVED